MPSSSSKPSQVAASPTAEDMSPAKLMTVLNDPKYARLMRNDLERDLVRYYFLFEDVPRQGRKEFWNRKEILLRLAQIPLADDLKALINDPRLTPFRDRRNAILATLRGWSAKPRISDDLMRDEGIRERPLRLWEIEGKEQRVFLASFNPKPSPPRTLSAFQIIHELLKPSGPLPKPPNDFLIFAEPGAKQSTCQLALPDRYQGLAGMAIGLLEENDNTIVVCQDGSLVRIPEPRMTDNVEAQGEPLGWLDARALAGSAAGHDAGVTFVTVEGDKPINYQIIIEIAGGAVQPKLVARSLSTERLKELAVARPQQNTGTVPRMIWAGCTRTPEMRLWAYDSESNELLGFNAEGRAEFRAPLLDPVDYDCLRGASIAEELGSFVFAKPDMADGVPLYRHQPRAVVSEVSIEDRERDPFRGMIRVIEWRGESWVMYPEFRRGNLVLRKIENQQLGARIPAANQGRVIDFESLATAAGPLLATREYDERQKKISCRAYEIHGDAWRATEDWHEPTDQQFVYLLVLESAKPVIYHATTTMPFEFERHELSSQSRP